LSRAEITALARLVRPSGDRLVASGSIGADDLVDLGLAGREVRELFAKLVPREVPDFELDPSQAKPAEYFAELFAQAVPGNDPKPTE
jgi:hypothetical protein